MDQGKSFTIGLDCRLAKTQSGIGRYTRELMSELAKRNDTHRYVFLYPDIPYYSLKEQLMMPKIIREAKLDLLHVPHFNVPLHCPVPFVVTIHDLILHHYPNQAGLMKRMAYKKLMKHAVQKSEHIIAVSNSTADDITKTYGDKFRSKTSVTYEGVSEWFQPATDEEKNLIRTKHDLPEKFLLYIGACKEHKNVQALIDACPDDQTLILVTGDIEKNHLKLRSNSRVLDDVSDNDLPALISAATLYIQPSLYEGFGLPILEAMACGTTVVASNRSSIPEISGGKAILVEPTVKGLRSGIDEGLNAPSDPNQMIEHAKNFSWEKMAEETANIYKRIL
jgi:glycosyltransferase involved in cell wall biosynthesis